jgi:hypothetical protein
LILNAAAAAGELQSCGVSEGGVAREAAAAVEARVGLPVERCVTTEEGLNLQVYFTVELDGETITCNSPRCIAKLLRYGWTLADPSQAELLIEALAAWDLDLAHEEVVAERRRRLHLHPRSG